MTVVYFPKPKGVRNPDRQAGSLLMAQVKHLRDAEKSLPLKYHSEIFSHAIQTESEAAQYIRAVTEAIRNAHDEAVAARRRKAPKRRKVIEIAAVADEAAERRRTRTAKTAGPKKKVTKKKKTSKGRRKP